MDKGLRSCTILPLFWIYVIIERWGLGQMAGVRWTWSLGSFRQGAQLWFLGSLNLEHQPRKRRPMPGGIYAAGRRQEIHQLQWCQRWNWETDRPSSWCLGLRSWDLPSILPSHLAIPTPWETAVYLNGLPWRNSKMVVWFLEPRLVVSYWGSNKGIVNDPIILTIYATGAPDLTLIDLPGITRVPVKGSDQKDDVEKATQITLAITENQSDSNYLKLWATNLLQPSTMIQWSSDEGRFDFSWGVWTWIRKPSKYCDIVVCHLHQWRKPFQTLRITERIAYCWSTSSHDHAVEIANSEL